ncbi:MAG: TraR/DksA C4-type zinc finger protein [Bacteroidota bacterium]|jgi:RNA polymerase-binding transcription factor DksA
MPTKKKAAKPAPQKKASKTVKSAPKKAVKKPSKPAPKKAVKKPAKPVKKSVPKKSTVIKPKKVAKPVKKIVKKATKPVQKKAAPVKPVQKAATKPVAKTKVAVPVKKAAPVKAAPIKSAPVKPAPVKAAVKPEVKKAVSTPVQKDIKPPVQQAIKALKKAVKEQQKPVVAKPVKTTVSTSVKYQPDFTKSVLDKRAEEVAQGPLVRYSDTELQEFKDLILRKLEAAKKELVYLQGLITRKDDQGGDDGDGRYMTMEDGSVSMEREQLSQMASRQITYIDHLEKALMRIENKTYGICRITGKLIDKARLRAVPHATLSMEAKLGQHKLPHASGE